MSYDNDALLECIVSRPANDDVVADGFDAVAAHYDAAFHSRRCRIEDALLAQRLRRFLAHSAGAVLDVGCGTGALLALTGLSPRRYTGIDISPEMLDRAAAAHPEATFMVGSADALPFNDGQFSAAASIFGALSYVAAPQRAISEMHRVLRPGGRCFMLVYAPRWYRRNVPVQKGLNLDLAPAAWTGWQARERLRRYLGRDDPPK